MTQLYTLAFPELNDQERDWINQKRKQNDPDFNKVRPHFTLLFGCADIPPDEYAQHVFEIARKASSFVFHARRVAPGVDYFETGGYVFLIPDEGNSKILTLHDQLYTGPLFPHLNLELQYIPHITLGRCQSLQQAKILCDDWNSNKISISGRIDTITMVEEENGKLRELEKFRLGDK